MSSSDTDRAKEIDEHIRVVEEQKKKAEVLKSKMVGIIVDARLITHHLDVTITNNANMIGYLGSAKESAKYVSPDNWKQLEGSFQNYSGQMGSYDGMIKQAENISKNMGTIVAVSSGLSSASVTTTITVVSAFTSEEIPPEIRIRVAGFTDTLHEDIASIKTNLESVDKGIAEKFDLVTKKWSAAPQTEKSDVILELRSVIFDQLFETFASESTFGNTNWHRSAELSMTPSRKKRIAEPKYFMIGVSEEKDIDATALTAIERTATEFQTSYDNLSKFGKKGTSPGNAEIEFRKAISLLNQSLLLRKIWYKGPTP